MDVIYGIKCVGDTETERVDQSWGAFKASNNRSIFRLTENPCHYCGEFDEHRGNTVDHIIPQCQGGTHDWDNLVSCCKRCNSSKGGRTAEQHRNRIHGDVSSLIVGLSQQLSPYRRYLSNLEYVESLLVVAFNLIEQDTVIFYHEDKCRYEELGYGVSEDDA